MSTPLKYIDVKRQLAIETRRANAEAALRQNYGDQLVDATIRLEKLGDAHVAVCAQLAEERAKREAVERKAHDFEISVPFATIHALEQERNAALAAAVAVQEECALSIWNLALANVPIHRDDWYEGLRDAEDTVRALDLDALRVGQELLEPLRRDKARIDLLESKTEWHICMDYEDDYYTLDSVDGNINDREYNERGCGATVREAIDDAIAAGKDKT